MSGMRSSSAAALLFSGLLCLQAHAQLPLGHAGKGAPGGGGGGCSQATTYIAALSSPTVGEQTAFTTAICDLVSNGYFSLFDGLYFFENTSLANAAVNVVQPGTYDITWHNTGMCTFTQDQGVTGDAANCYGTSTFNPSSSISVATQDSTTIGGCVLSAGTSDAMTSIGASDGVNYTFSPYYSGGTIYGSVNNVIGTSVSGSNAHGSIILSRTASTGYNLYVDGAQGSSTTISTGLPNATMAFMATNVSGTPMYYSGNQVAYAFHGAGMTLGQAVGVYNILHTLTAALGNSSC